MTINSKKVNSKDIIRLLDISDRDKSALLKLLPYDVELMDVIDYYLNSNVPMKETRGVLENHIVNRYPVRRVI
jgi:hypothetical protein